MQIRFQADYDFNKKIVRALRQRYPSMDFRTGHDTGLEGLPDEQVLEISARDGRILVSHDVNTMPVHFANFISNQNSPGVILIPQNLPIKRAVEELVLIWGASEAAEYVNLITWLPRP
ncbi:MAG: DUF5615 family PIN-like protein [Acidobacteriota bacterium]